MALQYMKKLPRYFLSLISCVFVLSSCHQQVRTDEEALADSVLDKTNDLMFADPTQAERRLAEFQKTLTDSLVWYRVELYRGSALGRTGDTLASQRIYDAVEAWSIAHEANGHLAGEVWNHRGVENIMLGRCEQAAQCYERAYKLLNCPPKQPKLISTTINLADIYKQEGRMAKAAGYYRYALFLSDSLQYDRYRSSIYTGLGQVYTDLENFDEAHYFFDLAEKSIPADQLQLRFFYLFALGNCYYFEGRYDEALRCFRQTYDLGAELRNAMYQLTSDADMAEVYLMQDSLPQARKHLQRCFETMKGRTDVGQSAQCYVQSLLADLYIAEGKRQEARTMLQMNVDSIWASSPRYLMLHYRRLQRYEEKDGHWERAYEMQERATRYADSLNNRQTHNVVEELAQRYERDTTLLRQQVVLADYEMRNARQQSYIFLVILAAVILALAGSLATLYSRRRTSRRLRLQMEKITELRMDVVRNRVSPHYIFNVLGTILPRMQKYPGLVGSVEMLIDVLRGNLLASDKVAVPLRDEIALVRRFVGLHHFCKGERPRVEWEIEEGLEESLILVPSMSLQIPVENALKHAFPELTDESVIRVVVKRTEGVLALYVHDNGQGYDPGRVCHTERDTGTGLLLLTRTIEILNRYNRTHASLTIRNVEVPGQGTCVKFLIPVDYRFETSKSKS